MHGNRPLPLATLLSFAPLCEGLEDEVLARIAAGSREVRLDKGSMLFRKDDPCIGFHMVIYGQVKVFYSSAQGEDVVVDLLGKERTFGEPLMLADQPYLVSAQALADSLLLFVPKAAILGELDVSPRLRLRLLKMMSGHLQQLIAEGGAYALQSGTQRFIAYLLRHLPAGDDPGGKEAEVTLSTSKANVSSMLNVTQEHFSRILRSLSKDGLISVQGSRILIRDLAALRALHDEAKPLPLPENRQRCRNCRIPDDLSCQEARTSPAGGVPCAPRPARAKPR